MSDAGSKHNDPDVAAEAQTRLIERLAASEKRHREILEELPEIVVLLDENGRVEYVNNAWTRLLGRDTEEALGRFLSDFILQEDHRKWRDLVEAATLPGDEVHDSLVRFSMTGETSLWMNVKIQRLNTGECVCSLEDFTTKRRLESALLKSQQLESLGRLAGGLAHDFNNFLTIILGNLNLAQSKIKMSEDVQEELDIAAKACMHASGVTKQMLTFSKGGAPVTSIASLADLVRESSEMALRGSKTKIELDIEKLLPPVEMDRTQMHQVFSNLMLNADQAMEAGGTLKVSVRRGRLPGTNSVDSELDAAVVEVTDQGVGIPADDMDRVFDPYFTTKKEGTGLGLTSAFWIIQRHGGYLEIESTQGMGTMVRVSLPLALDGEIEATIDRDTMPSAMRGRILIMDDNELVRDALQAMLESLGHEVVATSDGAECVDAFIEAQEDKDGFDLVILDLTVPGGHGGVWSFERLREIDPHVQAIVASGYGTDSVLAAPSAYGFKGRLQKPFEIEELQEVVDEVMLRLRSTLPEGIEPLPAVWESPWESGVSVGR